jgi:hypothetical protein
MAVAASQGDAGQRLTREGASGTRTLPFRFLSSTKPAADDQRKHKLLCRAGDERTADNKTGEIRYAEQRQQARDETDDRRSQTLETEITRRERRERHDEGNYGYQQA